MSFIAWIVVGLVAGVIANLVYPAPAKGGLFGAMALGIVGAMVGGYITRRVAKVEITTGINLPTIGVAVVGALVMLALWNFLF